MTVGLQLMNSFRLGNAEADLNAIHTARATMGCRPTAMPTRTSWHKADRLPSLT